MASFCILQRASPPRPTRLFIYLGIGLASFSPLALNVVAWDVWRFFALAQISAFLVLIAVAGQYRIPLLPKPWRGNAGYFLGVLAVLGAATAVPLFDKYDVIKPPYVSYIIHFFSVMRGESSWLEIPSEY